MKSYNFKLNIKLKLRYLIIFGLFLYLAYFIYKNYNFKSTLNKLEGLTMNNKCKNNYEPPKKKNNKLPENCSQDIFKLDSKCYKLCPWQCKKNKVCDNPYSGVKCGLNWLETECQTDFAPDKLGYNPLPGTPQPSDLNNDLKKYDNDNNNDDNDNDNDDDSYKDDNDDNIYFFRPTHPWTSTYPIGIPQLDNPPIQYNYYKGSLAIKDQDSGCPDYRPNYPCLPSTTGVFKDCGPLGYNECNLNINSAKFNEDSTANINKDRQKNCN